MYVQVQTLGFNTQLKKKKLCSSLYKPFTHLLPGQHNKCKVIFVEPTTFFFNARVRCFFMHYCPPGLAPKFPDPSERQKPSLTAPLSFH